MPTPAPCPYLPCGIAGPAGPQKWGTVLRVTRVWATATSKQPKRTWSWAGMGCGAVDLGVDPLLPGQASSTLHSCPRVWGRGGGVPRPMGWDGLGVERGG